MSAEDFDDETHARQVERDLASMRADRVDAAWDATYSDVPASALESHVDHLAEENEIGRVVAARRGYLDQQRSDRAMQRYGRDCARPTSPEELDAAHQRLGPLLAASQCPSTVLEPTGRYVETNPAPEALRRASSAGDEQDGPTAVAPRPGRWTRWCRWWSE